MTLKIDITKTLGNFTLRIALESGNERTGVLGASGSGKSMLLQCIAGLVQPDSGYIIVNGKVQFDSAKNINIPPRQRKTGYLFQNYALFPCMNVKDNLLTAAKIHGKSRSDVNAVIDRLQLGAVMGQKPHQLSGGQQQRTAIGRILLTSPEIIMLDEPFSALDGRLRFAIENELMDILQTFEKTMLFVSHNRDEVYRICQQTAVLDNGAVSVFGKTQDVFNVPQTLAAAKLTGVKNIAPAVKVSSNAVDIPHWGLQLQTKQPVPSDVSFAGVRAHYIREPIQNETTNCFTFNVSPHQNEPFRMMELLSIVPDRRSERLPLVRFMPVPVSPNCLHTDAAMKRYCIPPEHVLLLRSA